MCSECTGLMAQEIRVIPSVSRATLYFCPSCKETIKKMPQMQDMVEKTQEELKETKEQGEETKKNLAKLKSEVDSLKGSMERRRRENETVKGELTEIKKEIQQVKEKAPMASYAEALKKLEKKVETIKAPEDHGIELTLMELKEREHRATNVLLFGFDEPAGNDPQDNAKKDKETVASIFSRLNLVLSDTTKVFRLGTREQNRKRPLKVVLTTKTEAINALKCKKKLEENFPGKYMKNDQTENQRKYLKQVLAELEKQKSEGKTNIIIKYVKGIPTILEKPSKN